MFGFANALLLALFAAAGVDLVLALHRKAVGQLFTVPHYLFGDWGGEARARWGQRAFFLALMLYEFTVVFCNSMARENWPFLQGQLAPVLDMIMYTLLCGKILLGTRYTWRELICAGALYFVARWVYFNGQNIWFLGLVMVLLAAKDVPLRRSLQAFLGCGVPTLALVEVLHFAGIIAPDALSERSGSYRLMFGYGHPNTFGGIVFGLVLAWVLLRQAKITWAEIAAVAGLGLFLYKGPASRSPALCAFLLAVLLVCAKPVGARKGRKLTAGLCAAMGVVLWVPPLACGGVALCGFGVMAAAMRFNVWFFARLQAVLPQAQLGRVTGCTMALASLTQPVGQAVYGVLFDVFSACPAGVLLGAGAVSAAFLTGAMRHETEKRPG